MKKDEIICECGVKITGNSKAHAEANLRNHKQSKLHKEIMKNRDSQSRGSKSQGVRK